jgi:hypothetical protein
MCVSPFGQPLFILQNRASQVSIHLYVQLTDDLQRIYFLLFGINSFNLEGIDVILQGTE